MRTKSESFEEIAMPHLDAVYRAAVAICGGQSMAEDLVQDTFTKALNRFDLFEKGTNCKAWLLQILRNTWPKKKEYEQDFWKSSYAQNNMVTVRLDDYSYCAIGEISEISHEYLRGLLNRLLPNTQQ